jgi:cytochrome b6-f complex iron-sulfur subunit
MPSLSDNNRSRGTAARGVDTSRRKFLNRLWTGLGVLALLELIYVGLAFLRRGEAQPTAGDDATTIICGPVNNYAPGTVTAFVRGRFYLTRLSDGGFLAISRQCTHLGCTVPWVAEADQFACPCHGSTFDMTGAVISAPAPRALAIYPVVIENNVVSVNTRQTLQRSEFKKEQVVYPTQ